VKLPNLTPAVSQNIYPVEIYIFRSRVARVMYRILGGFFKVLIIPTLIDIYRHPLLSSHTTERNKQTSYQKKNLQVYLHILMSSRATCLSQVQTLSFFICTLTSASNFLAIPRAIFRGLLQFLNPDSFGSTAGSTAKNRTVVAFAWHCQGMYFQRYRTVEID